MTDDIRFEYVGWVRLPAPLTPAAASSLMQVAYFESAEAEGGPSGSFEVTRIDGSIAWFTHVRHGDEADYCNPPYDDGHDRHDVDAGKAQLQKEYDQGKGAAEELGLTDLTIVSREVQEPKVFLVPLLAHVKARTAEAAEASLAPVVQNGPVTIQRAAHFGQVRDVLYLDFDDACETTEAPYAEEDL